METGRSVPSAISTLFGAASLWPPALVRDADFAASNAQQQSHLRDRDPSADRVANIQLVQRRATGWSPP